MTTESLSVTIEGEVLTVEIGTVAAATDGGVSDHGALTGLADDDHSQYALADGTRGTFATAAQGALADTAVQPAAIATKLDDLSAGTADAIVTASADGTLLSRAAHTIATLIAHAVARANHTGSQLAATISDFATAALSAVQSALDLKAPLASPTFTGVPAAPTASGGTNTTQIATTAFVSSAVASAVAGLLEFIGNVDASTNPNYSAANKGDSYLISVAGKIGGASGKSVEVGDLVVASADNAGGTEAAVGTSWFVLEHNLSGALLTANALSELSGVASTARSNLGLAIGTDVQAYDADLTTWAGVAPGTGIATALAVNVGSAGAPVINGGALGTPSSGNLASCTFPTLNQNTTGYAEALKSATTTVSVSAATAPSSGQVLTATSSTAATWQTPSGATLSSNTFTGAQTVSQAVAAATTLGLKLASTTAATVGAQKWSPALDFEGSGWKTNATAAAQTVNWRMEMRPVQGTAAPSASMVMGYQVNGGGYTDVATFSSPVFGAPALTMVNGVDTLTIGALGSYTSQIYANYYLKFSTPAGGSFFSGPSIGTAPGASDPNSLNVSRYGLWFGRHASMTVISPYAADPMHIKAETHTSDEITSALAITAQAAYASAATNITGGAVALTGGAGASASAGAANGGAVTLDGGQGYGTGAHGNVVVGNTRGKLQLKAYAVASLGSATPAGMRAFANDANATTFHSVVAGGGANFVPVFSDGTDWRIG